MRGLAVAELGAGLGVVGLSAAKAGAATCTLIDREQLALHCAMATAECCGLATGPLPDESGRTGAAGRMAAGRADGTGVVSASAADWAEVSASLTVDVVLAAEVLYDPGEAAPLARCAAALLRGGGALLLADPLRGRAAGCRAAARAALEAAGAEVSEHELACEADGEALVLLRAQFEPAPREAPPRDPGFGGGPAGAPPGW